MKDSLSQSLKVCGNRLAILETKLKQWNEVLIEEKNIGRERGEFFGVQEDFFDKLDQEIMTLANYYVQSDCDSTQSIREMLCEYGNILSYMPGCVGALAMKVEKGDVGALVCGLAIASMQDGRCDPRELILSLVHLIDTARNIGIDVNPHLRKIAELSSAADRFGMGSIRKILMNKMR